MFKRIHEEEQKQALNELREAEKNEITSFSSLFFEIVEEALEVFRGGFDEDEEEIQQLFKTKIEEIKKLDSTLYDGIVRFQKKQFYRSEFTQPKPVARSPQHNRRTLPRRKTTPQKTNRHHKTNPTNTNPNLTPKKPQLDNYQKTAPKIPALSFLLTIKKISF